MRWPASSGPMYVQADAPTAAPAPSTLRNSRRLTPGFVLSVVGALISVVAVGAIVAGVHAIGGWRRDATRVRVVARGLGALRGIVSVHVAVDAPPHVQRRVLID